MTKMVTVVKTRHAYPEVSFTKATKGTDPSGVKTNAASVATVPPVDLLFDMRIVALSKSVPYGKIRA